MRRIYNDILLYNNNIYIYIEYSLQMIMDGVINQLVEMYVIDKSV